MYKMESNEDLFSKICRLCLSVNNSGTVPLFGSDGNRSCYHQAISLCTNVELPNLEYAPQNMCYGCLHQLRQCILFQRKCKRAKTYFENIDLNENSKNIKENLVKQMYRNSVFINDSEYDNSGLNNDKDGVNNEKHDKSARNNDKTGINNDINASSKGKFKQNDDINPKHLEFDNEIENLNKNNDINNDDRKDDINNVIENFSNTPVKEVTQSKLPLLTEQKTLEKLNFIQDTLQNEKFLNFLETMIEKQEIDNIKTKKLTNMISKSDIIKKVETSDIKTKEHLTNLSKKDIKPRKRKTKKIDNKRLELELFKLMTEDSEIIAQTKRSMSKYIDKIEKFMSLNSRKKAEKVDLNVKVICDLCQKVFKNKKSLTTHLDLRHGTKQYICEYCGKACATRSEIEVHKLLSHGAGRHIPCDVCGHKAPSSFDLKEHKRIHTGERPFTCDKCGLTFRRRYVWKQHQIYHTEKTIQCPKCPRKFHTVTAMRSHDNTTHERKYVFNCPVCAKCYAQNKTVRRHLREVHKVPRDKQGKIQRVLIGSEIS